MATLQEIAASPLAIVCHDAGSANLIVHWVNKYQGDIIVCMEGPARVIWRSKFPEAELLPIENVLNGAKTLLSGTGWGDLEYFARDEAKKKGLGVVSLGSKMIDPPIVKRALQIVELAVTTNLLNKNWKKK